MTGKMAVFSLRLSRELKGKLDRLAAADHRSLNSYISLVLDEHTLDPKERQRLELVLRAAKLIPRATK